MRFLRFDDHGEPSLIERSGDNIPAYGILSHTWGADNEEVTYEDLKKGIGMHKSGYRKIKFCAQQSDRDGLRFFWIDTCCINKANFTELSEAINSMFKWYRSATQCYVYLSDVSDPKDPASTVESAFPHSRWFKRGWTLQELIAPSSIQFFSQSGELLGSKKSRVQQIHQITGIDIKALQGNCLSDFSIEKRISWAAGRETKIEEDGAYCLLGIFDTHMPLIYGEGRQRAFDRLQRKARKSLAPFIVDHPSGVTESVQPTTQLWAVKASASHQELSEQMEFGRPSEQISNSQVHRIDLDTLPLQPGALLQTLRGHSKYVVAVAFSPDSKRLASASGDRTVKIWDAQSDAALQTLEGHSGIVRAVVFSLDGELLASASNDKTVKVWNTQSGVALQMLKDHSGFVRSVAFSPDSKLLASASNDQTVKL